jgi:hypothetical protein
MNNQYPLAMNRKRRCQGVQKDSPPKEFCEPSESEVEPWHRWQHPSTTLPMTGPLNR